MHQHVAAREIEQQVLAAAPDFADGLAPQAPAQVPRHRPAQAAIPHHDVPDAAAAHMRQQPTAGRFDFRQFRHQEVTAKLADFSGNYTCRKPGAGGVLQAHDADAYKPPNRFMIGPRALRSGAGREAAQT